VAIAYIPARGGSKGVQNKNLQTVSGKSLIRRTLETALAAGIFECIYLDTDSPEIAQEGERWGASIPFLRSPRLAQDNSLILECVSDYFSRITEYPLKDSEPIFLLQPTSPLREVSEILDCLSVWKSHNGSCSVATVSEPLQSSKDLIMRIGTGNWIPLIEEGSRNSNRQSFPPVKFVTGSIYVFSLSFIKEHKSFTPFSFTKYVEVSQLSSIDVDSEFDLRLANLLSK
jgi:CMP-N-acetylneuraminic acid synthetase